jgi:regulator of PEP synthase PpsR (kinase-PPPase family)
MRTKKILILGGERTGKTLLANIISKSLNIPVIEGVESLNELPNKEGIYTSNSIPLEVANIGLPHGFVLIHISYPG